MRLLVKLMLMGSLAFVHQAHSDTNQAKFCQAPINRFQSIVCEVNSENELKRAFQNILDEWLPHLAHRRILGVTPTPPDPKWNSQASLEDSWRKETKDLYVGWSKKCSSSWPCKQEQIAKAMELWAFPQATYEALVNWVKSYGQPTSLLTSESWIISNQVSDGWALSSGNIYFYGNTQSWLATPNLQAPKAIPPFLNRPLTYSEALRLSEMITFGTPNTIKGVNESVSFYDGGGAKCSANPLESFLAISQRFPDPPDTPNDAGRLYFKIVEVRNQPLEQKIPGCTLDNPYPNGFYPDNKESYASRVVIDGIRGVFVRPDGSFWLYLSDNHWYRFRRDMTSEAPEIDSKYFVLTKSEFDDLLEKSKTYIELNENLIDLLGKHRISKRRADEP